MYNKMALSNYQQIVPALNTSSDEKLVVWR